ncbi:ATP-binding protein [Rhodohalobacter mucosus]|uniref:AAA family ATPase n=1 Tax=Rhodohalobacter mucosus TaxID=2079485 RepID=A0A316TT78_9BACT|nr:AAA family ATPase [Rhodohalobacter mucosus]PWN05462.1 AAA family ATPase [Rhodohalobacter mucosus]
MDSLYEYQEDVLNQVSDTFFRSLYDKLNWNERFLGITGLRGTGKTTMLLQYLKYSAPDREHSLYVTADHPWFYDHTLFDLSGQFRKYGGTLLLIDEIHRYPNWSRELKNIYDGFPELQVIFTASSVLDILKGEADLSRRALTKELPGLSFREFLELKYQHKLPVFTLDEMLKDPKQVSEPVVSVLKPIPLFNEYLKNGYFPFSVTKSDESFQQLLHQVINTVMEVDLQIVEEYSASNTIKMKKLLGVIAESVPFEPNISKIAGRLELGRDTVKTYLWNLDRARLLNLLSRSTRGAAALRKPDKIYLENTNLSHALKPNPGRGTLRETFFVNQLRNAGHVVELAKTGDFIIDGDRIFEIGGPSKDNSQIRNKNNAWLALDDLEHPYLNRIPLWMFGFLY